MRARERGAALVSALLVLFLAAALSAALLERGRGIDAAAKADLEALEHHYARQGALAYARHRRARDPSWPGATLRVGTVRTRIYYAKGSPQVVIE
jgi:type II secretory pathway component PulK